jgi:hypothetical protein
MTTDKLMVFKSMPLSDDYENNLEWNFFLCTTNFTVTNGVVEVINGIPGVEVLNIVSRYKMKIGIGSLFNEDDVKDNIIDSVYASFEKPIITIPQVVKKTQNEIYFENLKRMHKEYKFFATVFTSGETPQTKLIVENDEEEAKRKLEFLLEENKESKVLKTWN